MIKIDGKEKCSGCTACYSACPKKCIKMTEDNEGFVYPLVEEANCINCNLCEKICPILNSRKEEKFEQKAYLVNNKNDNIRKESTSGGAFTAIAEYVIEKKGVVFGVTFDDEFNVIHKYIEKKEDIYLFRNSKYVQSDLKNCFLKAKEFLEQNRLVCFSGTPCQIEGLKSFLIKDYENLITVDIVCHAVPSPLVWKKYLKYIKLKLNASKITKVLFRDKSKYGYKYSTMTIQTDKKEYCRGVETDPYLRAFFKDLSDRPSCYKCNFKKQYRVSDFTIWDCFTVEDFDKKLDDNRGTTRILVHADKGLEIFNDIKNKFDYIETNSQKLTKNVKEMFCSVSENLNREKFFYDINNMDEVKFFDMNFPDTIKVKLERNIRKALAKTNFYKKIKKIIKKIIKK